jgi:hypothetical protein
VPYRQSRDRCKLRVWNGPGSSPGHEFACDFPDAAVTGNLAA